MRTFAALLVLLPLTLLVPPAGVPEAAAKGKRPRVQVHVGAGGGAALGIEAVDLTEGLRNHFGAGEVGVLVGGVRSDGPAAKAGLQVGDVIVEVDGEPVDTTFSIIQALADRKAGDEVSVVVVRDKKKVTLKAKVDERTALGGGAAWPVVAGPGGLHGWGVDVDVPGVQAFSFGGVDAEVIEKLEKKIEALEKKIEALEKRK